MISSATDYRAAARRVLPPFLFHYLDGGAVRAACNRNVPFIQSTVSVCPLAEVAAQASRPIWFQLYVLNDRGFMRDVMKRARDLGATILVFTVDMPVPGARYRDAHSGMTGPDAALRRGIQAKLHPR